MRLEMSRFGSLQIILNATNHAVDPCDLHTHSFIEISYIEEGVGTHTIGNHRYTTGKGDVSLINTLSPHRLEATGGHELKVINCLIDHSYLESLNLEDTPAISDAVRNLLSAKVYDHEADMRMKNRDMNRVQQLLRLMLQDYREHPTDSLERLGLYLKLLLCEISLAIEDRPRADTRELLAHRVTSYLQQHFCDQISLDVLSREYGYNDKYISRTFKAVTGMTVIGYLQRLRVEYAMKLLLCTDWPVADIAQDVGYHDITFFYRLFKKQTGFLPGVYRERNSKYELQLENE